MSKHKLTAKFCWHQILLEALQKDVVAALLPRQLAIRSNGSPAPGARLVQVVLVVQKGRACFLLQESPSSLASSACVHVVRTC